MGGLNYNSKNIFVIQIFFADTPSCNFKNENAPIGIINEDKIYDVTNKIHNQLRTLHFSVSQSHIVIIFIKEI